MSERTDAPPDTTLLERPTRRSRREGSPPRSRPTWLRRLALVGPAFVVGAWQFGPGNLTTAVQAGTRYGYDLVWVIAVSTALMIVYTDMAVRLGIRTPVSLLTSVKEHLGRPVAWLSGVGVFGITLMFSVGNAVGSGLGLSLVFGGKPVVWTVVCTAAVGLILLARNVYSLVERVLVAVVALMAVGFVASAFVSRPDWAQAAYGLVPELPDGSAVLVVALVGTNFSINAAFYTAYCTRERRRTSLDYREVTAVDTVPGIVAPGIMTALVILVAAVVLGTRGDSAATIVSLARVFEPLAGPAGSLLFALGLSGAAFSSMVANATAGGTMLSDALGRGPSSGSGTAKAVSATILAFGLVVTLVFPTSPVQLIVVAQSLTVLVAPVLGLVLLVMSNRRDLMGDLRNRPWQNVLGLLGLAAIVATSVRLVTTLL